MSVTRGNILDRIANLLGNNSTEFRTYLETSFNFMLDTLFDVHDWNWKHKTDTFTTVSGTEQYNLSTVQKIYHGAVAGGPFQVGEIITGGTSTATGLVTAVGAGFLTYTSVAGTLIISEVITGGTSGATATTTTAPTGGVSGLGDLRSTQDIEMMYDKTNGRFVRPVELRDVRKHYPKEDSSGQPTHFARWGRTTIVLHPNPDGAYQIKYPYIAKATYPADIPSPPANLDNVNLDADLGLPPYVHNLFEKMCLAEGMLFEDDTRRTALLEEIERLWKPKAIQADMQHLESNTRFKFWEEELAAQGNTYTDFLRQTWWRDQY